MKYYESPQGNTAEMMGSSIRPKAMTVAESIEKEEDKEGQTYFRKKLFSPNA